MAGDYRQNHYVPQWYQRRFADARGELFQRDLKPRTYRDARGRTHAGKEVHRVGPKKCFVERDLYTRFLGSETSTEIERLFLGKVDADGKRAVEAFSDFSVAGALGSVNDLSDYIGTQKLRTPKGLGWLAERVKSGSRDEILRLMVYNRRMYAAIWSECVWLIADASQSPTKFIISDHPVTMFNRHCGPSSDSCRGFNDSDVIQVGTHTIFPLSPDKVLLLTNLAWARNPYQNPVDERPNSKLTRTGIWKAMKVQTQRILDEREVREINFIIRSRALSYIAAAEPEWLYPEKHVSKSDWAKYGNGYLLMPDPRALFMGGTTYLGFSDGRAFASDEYGRKPSERGFETGDGVVGLEAAALDRFKGEFSRLYGPVRRGRGMQGPELEPERDSEDLHSYHLGLEAEGRRAMRALRRW